MIKMDQPAPRTPSLSGTVLPMDMGMRLAPAITKARYTETLSGDLGAQITDTPGATGPTGQGAATLTLANPHGDVVTTVTIPAGTTETTPAVTIDGWADYTEYGLPATGTTPAGQATIAGPVGYGWLGAKQRATTAEAAGLTLMGVRLYNNTRGLFTSVDPIPGGNSTDYVYPQDPLNKFDLDGRWPSWLTWSNVAKVTGVVAAGACIVASAGVCGVVGAVALGASFAHNVNEWRSGRQTFGGAVRSFGFDALTTFVPGGRWGRLIGRHSGSIVRRGTSLYRGSHRVVGSRVAKFRSSVYRAGRSFYDSTRANWRLRPRRMAFRTAANGYLGYRSWDS